MNQPRTPLKYDYSGIFTAIDTLQKTKGAVNLADLRVFYPKASWTELRYAVSVASNGASSLSYNEKTHEIKVVE